MRVCTKCGNSFEPNEKWKDRQKVCAACVLEAVFCQIDHMTDEEIDQELREEGVDVEAFKARLDKMVAEAMAKRGESS